MNFLEPDSDRAVRTSVDAFIDGRLRPAIAGDTVFETKNSRYRMLDGKIVAATDSRLMGSELVGWLSEVEEGTCVGPRWSAGARAVLLDRRFGRNIVVTSPTLMLEINGLLVEGSDTRPLPATGKTSQPAMLAVNPSMPVIPKPAGIPRWASMAVSDAGDGPMPPSVPPASVPPPSVPIAPSTPPPPGSVMPSTPPPPRPSTPSGRALGTPPPPPGRTRTG
jgi:hypothetical protein